MIEQLPLLLALAVVAGLVLHHVALLQVGCCCGSAGCPTDCTACPSTYTIVLTGFDAVFGAAVFDGTYALTKAGCQWGYSPFVGSPYIIVTCTDGVWTMIVAANGDALTTPGNWVWKFIHPPVGGCLPTGAGWTQTYCPSDLSGVPCDDGAAVSTS